MPRNSSPAAPPQICSASRRALLLFTIGLLTASPSYLLAQLPTPTLTSAFPPGGKQGTSLDVTIAGTDLDDAGQLIFSHAGITAQPKMTEGSEFLKPRPMTNQFVVSIAADVPPGAYELRAVGRFGLSNPRAFTIGTFDEIVEDTANKQRTSAKELTVPIVVNGRIEAGSMDYYKLTLKQGQRVIVDCRAQRIDSRADATFILYDASGKELTRVRDCEGLDPVLDFTAPADGDYVVGLYDFIFAGGADYFYRLAVHSGPQVDFVFPPSGVPGSNGKYTVYGRNLPGSQPADGLMIDGSPLEKVAVDIALPGDEVSARQLAMRSLVQPRGAMLDGIEYRLGTAYPTTVYFARAPVVTEQEPNNAPTAAQRIAVPCEYVGQFYPARDADCVQFDAKKGDVWLIEVIAHRMGLDCDPSLIVQRVTKNAQGEEVVAELAQIDDPADRATRIGTDFDTSTDDPDYRLVVDQDASYRVLVRDQFGDSRSDPRSVYRLLIRQAEPDFRLVATPVSSQVAAQNQQNVPIAAPVLRKGGSTIFDVKVDRRDGFKGEIQISAEELPPGVTCPGAVIGGDISSAPLVFMADENAASWAGSVRIVGKATIDGKEVGRYARGGAIIWGTANRQTQLPEYRMTRDIALSVMEKETDVAKVQVAEDKIWETSRGGSLEFPVKVSRYGDFKGELKLVAVGLPNELKPADTTIAAAASDAKVKLAVTNAAAKSGTYTFYLRADTKIKYARNPEAVAVAEEEKKEFDEMLKQLAETIKAATAARDAAVSAAQEAVKVKETEPAKAAEAEEAKAKADLALKELQGQLKQAEQQKPVIAKKVDDLKKAAAPKDVNVAVISAPIKVRILDSPIKISATAPAAGVKPGEKVEIPVKVERLFGFEDQVEFSFEPPAGVTGLTANKPIVAKGQADGKFDITAANNATPGEHTITIRAKVKFNNVNLESTEKIVVKVEPAVAAK